ncbi:MAG: sulfatase [Deltaproteobacteria bacterium]|nr:sulfatase [Deltaproteobacteria bacterium]
MRPANRWGLALWIGIAAIVLVGCERDQTDKALGPNVLLIVVDTLGADHLGSYGAKGGFSPNLDRLASEGKRFANTYATAPWTQPSMASLFTGRMPSTHAVENMPAQLAEEHSTLPEHFEEAGYQTQGIISHFLLGRKFGFAQGFADYDQRAVLDHTGISSEKVTDAAVEWLKYRTPEPFFLFVHYFDPHFVYNDHPEIDLAGDYEGPVEPAMPIWDLRNLRGDLNASDIEYLVSLYREEISFTDHHVGRLIQFLDEAGLSRDTLVVFTSDHGEEMMEHGWIGHTRSLYGELLRIPLFIRQPGVIAPGVVETPASLIDIAPTLDELVLDTAPDPGFEGKSLAALLFDRPADFARRRLYSEVSLEAKDDSGQGKPRRAEKAALKSALLGERWKMIHDRKNDEFEVYDVQADPGDHENLWGADPDRDASLQRELLEWERRAYR